MARLQQVMTRSAYVGALLSSPTHVMSLVHATVANRIHTTKALTSSADMRRICTVELWISAQPEAIDSNPPIGSNHGAAEYRA